MLKDASKISFEIWTSFENVKVNIWSTKWSTVLTNCIIFQNAQNFMTLVKEYMKVKDHVSNQN